ncbi:hypothetical protein FXO38_32949 [Capsicum annuum]|nr:hypothetical protein FXO38_32949 [Capsicum annuum]KAF3623499.1 hypothetical protein FXO37_31847 [Capsicum annuum]
MDRSGTGSYQKRTLIMECYTFFDQCQFNGGPVPRLHGDQWLVLAAVSNALTTSKEHLKIINRIWAHADQPSSSTSLVSALHTQLERARLQVPIRMKKKEDDGEVENVADCGKDSAKSDLHSIELNMDNSNNSYNWAYPSAPIQRSISGDGLDSERLHELEELGQRYSYLDEAQRLKAVKGLKDNLLASSGTGSCRDISSPIRQWEQPWPSRDPCATIQERSLFRGSCF